MKQMIVELSSQTFFRLSAHAAARNTTAEKLAAHFLRGLYCADEYDDISPEDHEWIEHGLAHADPDVLDADEGVRAYYDLRLVEED